MLLYSKKRNGHAVVAVHFVTSCPHIQQTMAAVLVADLTTNYPKVNSKHTHGFYQ